MGALVALGCSSASGEGDGSPPASQTQRSQLEVAAAEDEPEPKEITVATDRNAKCTLLARSTNESSPIWADDVGLVRLWAAQTAHSEIFILECDELAGKVEHVFDLSDPATFEPATPRYLPIGRKTLPALTEPISMTQSELVKAGYPPRPDPIRAPEPYKQWLAHVSTPMTLIPPFLVERPDHPRMDPVTYGDSKNWAGAVLKKPNTRYVWSLGNMSVPPCQNPQGVTRSRVSFWAGLDGGVLGVSTALIQNGFEYENNSGVFSYKAWYEYIPNAQVYNHNLVISPNHSVTYWAWECNASGAITVNGGHGCFWFKNNTTSEVWGTWIVPKPITPPNQFVGQTAEGIAERPGGWEDPNSLPVSQFPYFIGMQFSALDSVGNWHAMGLDPYTILRIYNQSGATLASGTNPFAEHDIVRFVWVQAQ